MKRTATAAWSGGLKDGNGTISSQSGVLSNTRYGFKTRFEEGPGTNPEELIAAAHAGCFTMALSAQLGEAGLTAESLRTDAAVTLEQDAGGFTITAVHLNLSAKVPGASREAFDKAVNNAKVGCPVSKLLKADITVTAKLEGEG
ncbi:MAG TPA: OsmC family protein [Noviherbaspirillum sp.]|uniref:OsmC family protein n=1 Tax=Noviherbaspirillum sp. TaxID=1926288 RepID=UPI002D488A84|nr:OsmC family protein [Noviherbaspirillum sp.]HYD93902.1 OsmC family protein [Noviherbaspirillum sp.]